VIFVDTSAWFASFVKTDSSHSVAKPWFVQNAEGLVTSDLILCELFTLLKVRRKLGVALDVGDDLWTGTYARVEAVLASDLQEGWTTYKSYRDKAWSFVDCVTRAMMERLDIQRAFAFDEHFRQFGTVTVVP
jgi:predicted nucleic acid-binding protein